VLLTELSELAVTALQVGKEQTACLIVAPISTMQPVYSDTVAVGVQLEKLLGAHGSAPASAVARQSSYA
jgi:hypothetical protein